MPLPDPTKETDRALAHALARAGLGLNLLMHGVPRLFHWREFAEHVAAQFAHPPLPLPGIAVNAVVYGIPPVEAAVGALLVLGLWTRPALIVGTLALFPLIFGTNLLGNYAVAAEQLVYLLLYAALLATAHWDYYSTDGWLRRRRHAHRDDPCR